jgi:hypothetical protein
MDDRKKAQMMNDLAGLNSAAGMKQGVKSDVSLDKLDKNQTQTVMQLWGNNTGKVWSEQDVQEFMNEWDDPREETLLEFLNE